MYRDINTDLLRAFVAVHQAASFTKAAGKLCRTQAAVSMQIKRLEERLDKKVFVRSYGGLNLTGEGEILMRYAKQILQLNDEMLTDLDRSDFSEVVRIGMSKAFSTTSLPQILIQFRQWFPNAHVKIVCESGDQLVQQISNYELDLAVVSCSSVQAGVEILHQEPLCWVASKTAVVHETTPIPLVFLQQENIFRDLGLETLRVANRAWQITISSNSPDTILGAVLAGVAITVMKKSDVPEGMQCLCVDDGLPPLPNLGTALYLGVMTEHRTTTQVLAKLIRAAFEKTSFEKQEVARRGGTAEIFYKEPEQKEDPEEDRIQV